MFLSIVLPSLFALVLIPGIFLLFGISRWQSSTLALRERLEAARARLPVKTFDPAELEGLPAPVQRYFEAALTPGQPMIAVAEFVQRGEINLSGWRERWTPCQSSQVVVTERPGFDWDARIRRRGGLQIFVHDAYIAGEGLVKAAAFGLMRVAERRDRLKLADGELMRFLAEAAWYPTKLLPSQGVRWEAIDDDRARATIVDGEARASLVFTFDVSGMISSVQADKRLRMQRGKQVETPWEGRFWGHEIRSGMRIPTQAEAAWIPGKRRHPYWRGQVTDALYKFAA